MNAPTPPLRAADLRAAIIAHCSSRPGITAQEVAAAFGMCRATVSRHLQSIKSEWRARDRVAQKEGEKE